MKKRIASAVMALILCLTLLPATVLADDTGTASSVAKVSTMEDLNAALRNESVAEIHIIANMTYKDPLVASKLVRVNEGVTLTLNDYQTTVSGTIINNGTIQVNSKKCFWTATTTGTGKLIGGTDSWGGPFHLCRLWMRPGNNAGWLPHQYCEGYFSIGHSGVARYYADR